MPKMILLIVMSIFCSAIAETISIVNNTDQALHLQHDIPKYAKMTISLIKLDLQSMLHKAIICNDIEGVRWAIAAGANVNFISDDKNPLLVAALLSRTNIINLLLESGAELNVSIIEQLALRHKIETASLLIMKSKIDINTIFGKDTILGNRSLLGYALIASDFKSALLLIRAGASLNADMTGIVDSLRFITNKEINDTIQVSDLLALMQELIDKGYDIHNCNNYVWRNLLRHSHANALIKLLIKNNVDLNRAISLGYDDLSLTPLFIAIDEGALDAIKALLEAGANISQKASNFTHNLKNNNILVTPLSYAINLRKNNIADFLLEYGAQL